MVRISKKENRLKLQEKVLLRMYMRGELEKHTCLVEVSPGNGVKIEGKTGRYEDSEWKEYTFYKTLPHCMKSPIKKHHHERNE